MRKTVEMAKARGVSVGAHPGYRDLHGFGRRPVPGMTSSEIEKPGRLSDRCVAGDRRPRRVTRSRTSRPMARSPTSACADDMTARAIASAIKGGSIAT